FPGLCTSPPYSPPVCALPPPPPPPWGVGGGGGPTPRPLTLLYAAKNTEQNHARVLAAWLAALPVTI
ncbi:hypothetical protein M2988_24205, partial [Klebsiella pneumoniae]|nr:hypothetical protein [Klebsiella pneumoniae]